MGLISRLDKIISELESRMIEITQCEEEREKHCEIGEHLRQHARHAERKRKPRTQEFQLKEWSL